MSSYKPDSETLLAWLLPRLPLELCQALRADAHEHIEQLKGKPGNDLLPTLEHLMRQITLICYAIDTAPPASNPTSRL